MRWPWQRSISLADKCLLLFGGAIVLIIVLAMIAPWVRMKGLIRERQFDMARRLVEIWQRLDAEDRTRGAPPVIDDQGFVEHAGIKIRPLTLDEAVAQAEDDPFLRRVVEAFGEDPKHVDDMSARWDGVTRIYRYARAVRPEGDATTELSGVLLHEQRSDETAVLLIVNSVYLLGAGLLVLAMALLVFYLITHKIILAPVRSLKETAARVREGDLSIRSDIQTGDELQQLAETFNQMLHGLQSAQEQQSAANRALDLKLGELSEANSALFESNRLKGEFLANVSHELRTPLNSIIGFAELLMEIARSEGEQTGDTPALSKRTRYQRNIVSAGRSLLEMIESLLELAKIEAGRVEIELSDVNVRDVCESLAALILPLAQQKGIEIAQEIASDAGTIRTDPKRLHQVLFNFLSNAVKFTEPAERTGRIGRVTLRAERLRPRAEGDRDCVRLSVIDTGPGIPEAEQHRIFEKFYQIDAGHTREHRGTGLGLAISRELASLLQGEIQLVSEIGRGSMFSVILPVEFDEARSREQRLESAFRGSLSGRRAWNGA
ncbi:MAG: HAMP domain-containing histidine kinase [Phycisphaeraceae bacterium]|nr:HAMP domain-containing histidine kinase [Phycisphaeraceae bacterium]